MTRSNPPIWIVLSAVASVMVGGYLITRPALAVRPFAPLPWRLARPGGVDRPTGGSTPRSGQGNAVSGAAFAYDVDLDGDSDDWDKALYVLDLDGDRDIDMLDWAAWSASGFQVPSATVAVPLEHCPTMDGKFCRSYRMQHSCPVGPASDPVDPDTTTWVACYPWPLHWPRWIKYATGPLPIPIGPNP